MIGGNGRVGAVGDKFHDGRSTPIAAVCGSVIRDSVSLDVFCNPFPIAMAQLFKREGDRFALLVLKDDVFTIEPHKTGIDMIIASGVGPAANTAGWIRP